MNIKEGFKRIFLALGYALFSLLGFATTSIEDIYIIRVFGFILGFYAFKGLCYCIKWIIAGFKE